MPILVAWLHVLAAVSWIGGMIFLSLVLAPVFRREGFDAERAELFRTIARRFRTVAWGAIAILLSTGPVLVSYRGIPVGDPLSWPRVLGLKLGLVAVLLILTMLHDKVLGPRTARMVAVPQEGRTPVDRALVIVSSWLPRLALFLALAVVFVAVMLARL